MKLNHTLSLIALALVSTTLSANCFAQQDGTFPPQGPGGRGEGQQGERPRAPVDPQQFIDRMMQNDANGDGMLSKDELPPQLAERLMARADTNKDGMLDKGELEAAAQSGAMGAGRGAPREGGRVAPREGGPEGAMNVEGAMKQMNRAYKALGNSAFDESSRATDLGMIQALQSAIVAAKGGAARLPMSEAAKAKFGDDRARFDAEFRGMMLDALIASIELEKAVLEGNGASAKAGVAKLHELEEKGHELFQPAEGEARPERGGRGEAAPSLGGKPEQPARGARGGRQEQGGGLGTGRPPRGAPNGG